MHGRYWSAKEWCVNMCARTYTRSKKLPRTTERSVLLPSECNPNYPCTLVFALQCEHGMSWLLCHAQLSLTRCLRNSPNMHSTYCHATQGDANVFERSYSRSKTLHCKTVQFRYKLRICSHTRLLRLDALCLSSCVTHLFFCPSHRARTIV